ncbi:MAG TPA: DMT family transporter [Pyrinomonadaceae bacterium]
MEARSEELTGKARAGVGQDAQAYLSMMLGAFSFAAMGALSHLAGELCGWQVIAAARTSVAFALSLLIALLSGVRLAVFRPRVLWVRSLVGSVGVLFAFYALTHLPISTAITLSNTFPIWVALLAWPVLGYRPNSSVLLAILAGVVGVVLIQKPYMTGGGNLAGLAALGTALCTAIAMIGLNRLSGVDSRAVVVHFSGVSTVIVTAFLLLTGAPVGQAVWNNRTLAALLVGVGVAGTAGQFGMTRAFALGHPSKVSVVGLTQIVFALAFDLILWKHRLDAFTLCGILLVVAPTAWLLIHSPLRKAASVHTST